MAEKKVYRAIGLMSGTSLDGVDVALIETDGHGYVKPLDFANFPYSPADKRVLRTVLGKTERNEDVKAAEDLLTRAHAVALKELGWNADIIGFHGQTIYHNPAEGQTIQMGDGAYLAQELGVDVVGDFRSADVAAGGQGAPLLPLYHYALVQAGEIESPIAVLNIGGVANVSFVGADFESLFAFDTGPGNALMDDFIEARTGAPFDENGQLAFQGRANKALIEQWMVSPYFTAPAPKSLDRDAWDVSALADMSTEDGLATLAGFTVAAVIKAHEMLPEAPHQYIVCGGGRHNEYLMRSLSRALEIPFKPAESMGWNGDAVEAEGFAYFAVRSILGEAITFPGTTGAPKPMSGGVLHRAKSRAA